MFTKTIDNKNTILNENGDSMIDIGEGIFNMNSSMSQICSVYRASSEHEMRPDLISRDLYGSTDYTEMILKYSMISNPFSVEMDDNIYGVSLPYIYNTVKDVKKEEESSANYIKNYHKYIDKGKVPSKYGSDGNNTRIQESSYEANISKTGNTGISVKNGKVYFGETSSIDDRLYVDSSIVDCAESGVSLGEFLNAAIRNSI